MTDSWIDEFERIYENGDLDNITRYRSKGLYTLLNFVHGAETSQIQEHVLENAAPDSLDIGEAVEVLDKYSSIVPSAPGREGEGVRFRSFEDPDGEYLLSSEEAGGVNIDFDEIVKEVKDEPRYSDPHVPSTAGDGSRSGRNGRR